MKKAEEPQKEHAWAESDDFWPALELNEGDGVMVLVIRKDGKREIYFPRLGLMTEGRIEQAQMDMYRSLMRARAAARSTS
jgi:hypothetical protein